MTPSDSFCLLCEAATTTYRPARICHWPVIMNLPSLFVKFCFRLRQLHPHEDPWNQWACISNRFPNGDRHVLLPIKYHKVHYPQAIPTNPNHPKWREKTSRSCLMRIDLLELHLSERHLENFKSNGAPLPVSSQFGSFNRFQHTTLQRREAQTASSQEVALSQHLRALLLHRSKLSALGNLRCHQAFDDSIL